MQVKILGTGCAKCNKLYEIAAKAIAETGVDAELVKVEKIDEIVTYGVAMTPGLVIDGQVKSAGKLPSVSRVASWLRENGAAG